ncbi:hypothetical protein GOP47_0012990 [Adiantum capillus-veneris]|uniref:C2 domain-containing protein n=1 Tax=Adiantum capillus-veneris TaxID=13818 RepID=A0A9D4US59_ADICA|nr:hypothetical protein GOP47_0012990 [Adiantum capillus-veneris]
MEAPRKLVVEICSAHNLMPKDGEGSASAYVQVDFGVERRRTKTKPKDLNPVWEEAFEFLWLPHSDASCHDVCVEVTIFHEMRGRAPKFMGTVCVPGSLFAKKGEETLIVHNLERWGLCSQIKGAISMKVYYYTEEVPNA